MLCAPIPLDDEARLEALASLKLLDTAVEARFDNITEIAASYFNVPIALVSLVDGDRQWFKSKHGLDASLSEKSRSRRFLGR